MIDNNQKKATVVVGMSGGIDSSVSALLLKNQGYNVIGLHMKNTEQENTEDEQMAKQICEQLGIELNIVNYTDQMDKIKEYFITEYANNRTPNPCVLCNKEIKFKPFIEYTEKIGADYFATGHYAKTECIDGRVYLTKAVDEEKDQTYFLNQLSQYQLKKALFPLGNLKKAEVRKIAEENNLISAHKKDSFDVCFIGSSKFKDFMRKNYPEKSGNIVDIDTNKIVGKHDGISKFTFGQRKGLGVGGTKGEIGRWFVVKKDIQKNILYVSTNEEKHLFAKRLIAKNVNFIPLIPKQNVFECYAKIRYRQQDQKCRVTIQENNSVLVEFENPQRAISQGQFVVFYDEKHCLGGGVIDEILGENINEN